MSRPFIWLCNPISTHSCYPMAPVFHLFMMADLGGRLSEKESREEPAWTSSIRQRQRRESNKASYNIAAATVQLQLSQ